MYDTPLRDGSKSTVGGGGGGGGPEQRGGGLSVFEPLVRGGLFNFQRPMGSASSYFITGIGTHLKNFSSRG